MEKASTLVSLALVLAGTPLLHDNDSVPLVALVCVCVCVL